MLAHTRTLLALRQSVQQGRPTRLPRATLQRHQALTLAPHLLVVSMPRNPFVFTTRPSFPWILMKFLHCRAQRPAVLLRLPLYLPVHLPVHQSPPPLPLPPLPRTNGLTGLNTVEMFLVLKTYFPRTLQIRLLCQRSESSKLPSILTRRITAFGRMVDHLSAGEEHPPRSRRARRDLMGVPTHSRSFYKRRHLKMTSTPANPLRIETHRVHRLLRKNLVVNLLLMAWMKLSL